MEPLPFIPHFTRECHFIDQMAFASLVQNLELSAAHVLVASMIELSPRCCVPLLQSTLHFGDSFMHAIISDFFKYGLCIVDDDDALFIKINYAGICHYLRKLPPSPTVTNLLRVMDLPTAC